MNWCLFTFTSNPIEVAEENQLDIAGQLSRTDLFEAFKAQLAKDCEQSNFPNDFVSKLIPDYHVIQNTLAQELKRNENKTDFHINHLLYRIDISEMQLRKYLSDKPNESYFMVLAELIIKRVLQKVVIRKFYRNI